MRFVALLRGLAVSAALPVALVAVWWFATAGSTSFFFPPLRDIVAVFGDTWFTGRLGQDVMPSLLRLAAGYGIAVCLGIAAGLVTGSSRLVRAMAEPVLAFLRAVPPTMLVPILVLMTGVGDRMKILVIVSGCLWPILLNTAEGVRAIDPVLHDTARAYRMRWRSRVLRLVLPGAGPQIAAGCRQALSVGIILMVISEMYAASSGLGFSIVQFQRGFAIPQMWTGIILLGVLGVLLSMGFRFVESRALAWYQGQRQSERENRS